MNIDLNSPKNNDKIILIIQSNQNDIIIIKCFLIIMVWYVSNNQVNLLLGQLYINLKTGIKILPLKEQNSEKMVLFIIDQLINTFSCLRSQQLEWTFNDWFLILLCSAFFSCDEEEEEAYAVQSRYIVELFWIGHRIQLAPSVGGSCTGEPLSQPLSQPLRKRRRAARRVD